MDEEKEICCEEAGDSEETLETFNEDEYFKRQKEFFKKTFERDQLRKKQRELTQKARKEVLKELGKEGTEDDRAVTSPSRTTTATPIPTHWAILTMKFTKE